MIKFLNKIFYDIINYLVLKNYIVIIILICNIKYKKFIIYWFIIFINIT